MIQKITQKLLKKWRGELSSKLIVWLTFLVLMTGLFNNGNAQVMIGSGSTANVQRFPFSYWYGYSRDATIYTAAELNTITIGDTITTLSWKSSIASSVTAPIVIYLKAVGSTTQVASDTWANTITGATQVYAGTPVSWVVGWNTIDITDFVIPVGQNVEVLVECAYGGGGGGGQTGTQFTYTTSGSNTHGYWQKDTDPPILTQTANGGGIDAQRPDIIFGGLVAADMSYASATTTQSSSSSVTPGSTNQQMIRLAISVNGINNPLTVSQINFNTGNTNLPADINNAKVYYTGESTTFATTTQFGTTVNNPNGAFSITGSQILTGIGASTSTYYFWLTYDVNCSITNTNDSLDAVCNSFTIASASQIPTVTNPAGTRVITVPVPTYTATTSTSATVGTIISLGRINITGDNCNSTVTSVTYNTATSPVADISRARCYYTTGTTFNTDSLFGNVVVNPNGNIVFNGSKTLASGTGNYFWVTYDISCGAGTVAGIDSVTAIPVSITTNNSTITVATPFSNAKKKVNAQTAPSYTATSTTSTPAGTVNLTLGRINIIGDNCNTTVSSVIFNTATSLVSDISQARCYYTTGTTFNTDSLFGSPVVNPNGNITFTGSKALVVGSGNNFWLAYDIACNAGSVAGIDTVTATPVSITTNAGTINVAAPATNAKKGITVFAATTIADGNWNSPSTWACGIIPTSTTTTTINHNITVTTSGNTVGDLTIASGKSLTISAGDLTSGPAGGGNKVFTNNGNLTVTGGTLNVNGSVLISSGSTFTQSGGDIIVDGNDGTLAGSATGNIFSIGSSATSYSSTGVSLTGGRILIVDPTAPASTSLYAFVTYLSSSANNITASVNHTLQIGDGVSTTAGGSTNGFYVYFWPSTGAFKPGNYVVNTGTGSNRFIIQQYRAIVGGNLNIISGELRLNSSGPYNIAGNITVAAAGTLTSTVPVALSDGTYAGSTTLTPVASTVPQTISGAGIFRNSTTASTANFTSLTINNTNPAGVTFADANSLLNGSNTGTVSGTLTMTAGIVNVGSNALVLGISAASTGTYTYTAGMIVGSFKRWLGASTGTRAFDIGMGNVGRKVSINFTTAPTAGGSLTAKWNSSASGTAGLPLTEGSNTYTNTSQNGYWTVSAGDGLTGGTYTVAMTLTGGSDAPDYSTVTIGKRSTSADPWALAGTAVAPTGTASNYTVSRTGVTGFSDFTLLLTGAPLSVKLSSFTGRNAGAVNILNWATATEKDASHFDVLRSDDGNRFEKLTTVDAKNVMTGSKYEFTDTKPFEGKNFYRLNMVDVNGKSAYSDVVVLSVKSSAGLSLAASPNPVNNTLNVTINGKIDGKAMIQVVDITGKIVQKIQVSSNNTAIDMNALSNGTYIIKYNDNSNASVIKVIKN